MSEQDQEEKLVAAIPVPQIGFLAQVKKGVEVTLATKKAAVAAYALFFGVTVGTANMTASGLSEADVNKIVATEIEKQKVLEETVVTLETRVTELQTQVVEMESHAHEQHDHAAIVGLIDLSKETTAPHAHEFIPHSHQVPEHDHPIDPDVKAWFDSQSDKFVTHSHEVPEHEHKKMPTEEPANSDEYKHKDPRNDTCARSCH